MMEYQITIPGEPTGKARPRVTANGTYTPQKTKQYEMLVRQLFRARYGKPMLTGNIAAVITAYFGINKTDYGKTGPNKTGRAKLTGEVMPTKKPDADNIAKIVLDALNEIAYADDGQVVSLTVEKHYAETPRVELSLMEVTHE